jgi:hypothetical protein
MAGTWSPRHVDPVGLRAPLCQTQGSDSIEPVCHDSGKMNGSVANTYFGTTAVSTVAWWTAFGLTAAERPSSQIRAETKSSRNGRPVS